MIIFHTPTAFQHWKLQAASPNGAIGFVPTMGALHQGHIALVKASKERCRATVVSIFVNPTQFNDQNDFNHYPITLASDILLLEQSGCDVLLLPKINAIYPEGMMNLPTYDIGELEMVLEGKYRPGHFQGVCQVVHRLLQIVQPSHLFMGQKDYQQCLVVQKLITLCQLPVQLHTCPTLRESDGLAMSSRNKRLQPNQRHLATAIYQQLSYIKHQLGTYSIEKLVEAANDALLQKGFTKIDYVAIANPTNLCLLDEWRPTIPTILLIAAYINDIRLIDNMLLEA